MPTVDLRQCRDERTEFSPRVDGELMHEQEQEQEQEEHMGEQSIYVAGDAAVDRLAAISSDDVASQETIVVVLKMGWCPDLGGHGAAVVSVHKAVGAGFGYLAGGMPVLRAGTTGLVQEATLRVADEHVPVKEAPIVAVDAALTMEVKICEAVPACMESMGLLIEVLQMVLSPAVYGAVVGRCVGALAVLASMAVNIECSGSDPPGLRWLVDPGCDPPMLSCC